MIEFHSGDVDLAEYLVALLQILILIVMDLHRHLIQLNQIFANLKLSSNRRSVETEHSRAAESRGETIDEVSRFFDRLGAGGHFEWRRDEWTVTHVGRDHVRLEIKEI